MQPNHKKIQFQIKDTEIDYFKLEEEYFQPFNKTITKEKININEGKYLSDALPYEKFNSAEKETVVLNFQVGKGKSRLLYNLIERYYREGFKVIVCSPYIKLVNKDFGYLNSKLEKIKTKPGIAGSSTPVCNYLEIEDWYEEPYFDEPTLEYMVSSRSIHIMTINCFLGNPGDNTFEQSFQKRNYISKLYEATEDEKVILIIDEIHDSIHNFKAELFPRLLKWKKQIQKIFIASATFSPEVLPAINLLSKLTNDSILILEGDRKKDSVQAKINLHILPYHYTSGDNRLKYLVKQRFDFQIKKHRIVNIITASKSLAESLAPYLVNEVDTANQRDIEKVIKDAGVALPYPDKETIYLLTGETNVEYQKGKNNIGTTFNTGVDIEESNAVLFIIFPSIVNGLLSNLQYGIFSKGISPIIQSVGRIRNGSRIEMFIAEPRVLINDTTLEGEYLLNKKIHEYLGLNSQYDTINSRYQDIISREAVEIVEMQNGLQIANNATDILSDKMQFGFWYPNFHEFILKDNRAKLTIQEYAYGKEISPYVLWACLNNQFLNATLKSIKYYLKTVKELAIDESNSNTVFTEIIKANGTKIKHKSFRELISNPKYYFGTISENGDVSEIKFIVDEQKLAIATLLNRKPFLAKQFVKALISNLEGNNYVLDYSYINICITEAVKYILNPTPLQQAYLDFKVVVDDYITWIKQEMNSSGNNIPTAIQWQNSTAISTIQELKKQDWIFSSKALSFFQNANSQKFNISHVNNEFRKLFLDVQINRKKGKSYYQINKINYPVSKFPLDLL